MKALSQAVPSQVSAGIGNLRVIAFSGLDGDDYWVHMEICEGSYGGRKGIDGMDSVDTLYANTRNNPIEDIESHLPLRVTRYELREDVCGAGKWRGGLGSIREFTYLKDGGGSIEGEGHKYKPWGFSRGEKTDTQRRSRCNVLTVGLKNYRQKYHIRRRKLGTNSPASAQRVAATAIRTNGTPPSCWTMSSTS